MLPRLTSSIIVVVLLTACAAALRPKVIGDLKSITGTWTGHVKVEAGPGSGTHDGSLVINDDGSWVSNVTNLGSFTGTILIVSGKAKLKNASTGDTATATLYEREGREVLIVAGDTGSGRGELVRTRK